MSGGGEGLWVAGLLSNKILKSPISKDGWGVSAVAVQWYTTETAVYR